MSILQVCQGTAMDHLTRPDRFYLYGGATAHVRDRQSDDHAAGNRRFIQRIVKVLNACEHLSDEDLDGWVTRLVREAETKS